MRDPVLHRPCVGGNTPGRYSHRLALATATLILGCLPLAASAQELQADGEILKAQGLEIPAGPVSPGGGQCVLVRTEGGAEVAAKVYVNVGEQRVLLLPDGRLVARSAGQSPVTQQPFQPATMEEIAQSLGESALRGFQKKETRHYLYLYNASQPFAETTSRILETMFRGVVTYAQAQQIDVHVPPTPLVVIIFRTADEFQEYRRMPEGTVAYYDWLTNRVVMYEESPLWKIKPELALQQALATIAHEGAHQILHNIGVQQRLSLWPLWLNEGLAEFFAPTTTDRQLKWKGAGQVNDLRMFELEQWLKSRSNDDADGQLVAQTIGAARLTSTGYAAAWALTHYLAKNHRAEFQAFVRQHSRLGPLEGNRRVLPPGVMPENVRLFKEHFGEDLAEIERRLILHLKNQPYVDPFVERPHFVAVVSLRDGRKDRREANVFHTPDQAERWRREIVEQAPEDQRADVQSAVHPFPNRVLAENFARQWLQGG
jgi:hypothetical protein